MASEAVIAAPGMKKEGTAFVSQGSDIIKSLYQSDNEHSQMRALVGLCKLGTSGGSDAAPWPSADGSSTKLAEACRRFLINPGKDSDRRRGAAGGLSYLTTDANGKEKWVRGEPALRALSERGTYGAQNERYGVMATIVIITNSYAK